MEARGKKQIGEIIKVERKKNKLTQKRLAEESGLSRSYISDVEAGRYAPSVKSLLAIAKILKFDLNFLL